MAEKLDIKLRICGKEYELGIQPEKEELYRLAAREVNEGVTKWSRAGFGDFTSKDLLALVALELASDKIRMSQSREVGNDDVKELNRISDEITGYMNRLGE